MRCPAMHGCGGGITTRRQRFPYQRLVEENARRSRDEPEFELLDTGVFDDGRYWSVDVAYAKASPTEVLARITIENHSVRGSDAFGVAYPVVPQHVAGFGR